MQRGARTMRIELEFSHTMFITTGARRETTTNANCTLRSARRIDDRPSSICDRGRPPVERDPLDARNDPIAPAITLDRSLPVALPRRGDHHRIVGRCRICGLTPKLRPLTRFGQGAWLRWWRVITPFRLPLQAVQKLDEAKPILDRIRNVPALPSGDARLRNTNGAPDLGLGQSALTQLEDGVLYGSHDLIIRRRITRSIRTRLIHACIVWG